MILNVKEKEKEKSKICLALNALNEEISSFEILFGEYSGLLQPLNDNCERNEDVAIEATPNLGSSQVINDINSINRRLSLLRSNFLCLLRHTEV